VVGTDHEGARQGLMNSLGGIPKGRPGAARGGGGPRRLPRVPERRFHHGRRVCHRRRHGSNCV